MKYNMRKILIIACCFDGLKTVKCIDNIVHMDPDNLSIQENSQLEQKNADQDNVIQARQRDKNLNKNTVTDGKSSSRTTNTAKHVASTTPSGKIDIDNGPGEPQSNPDKTAPAVKHLAKPNQESSQLSKDLENSFSQAESKKTSTEAKGSSGIDDISMKKIKDELQNLPKAYRPANIDVAVDYIQKGDSAWDSIKKGKTFDAVVKNIDAKNFVNYDILVLKDCFDVDDEVFWNKIKDDTNLQALAKKNGLPFSRDALNSKEYGLYLKAEYVRDHTINPKILEEYLNAYQTTIVQVQWHLYSKAILVDKAFHGGMITFKDPQSYMFNLLDTYAELISPNYKNVGVLRSLFKTGAYNRESSHWDGQRARDGKNFGIDILSKDGKSLPILPGNNPHLLFGERTNGMTFVKWEEHGTSLQNGGLSHALSFIKTRGENDETVHSKERVPKDVMSLFEKLYKAKKSFFERIFKKDTTSSDVKTYGISKMLELLEKQNPANALSFKNYLISVKKYDPKTLNLRKGGEVILPEA